MAGLNLVSENYYPVLKMGVEKVESRIKLFEIVETNVPVQHDSKYFCGVTILMVLFFQKPHIHF